MILHREIKTSPKYTNLDLTEKIKKGNSEKRQAMFEIKQRLENDICNSIQMKINRKQFFTT